jgi:REP element-mobilizing transposase RayT
MKSVKNIRLKDYDYSSDGYYFVTICTNYGKPYLKEDTKKLVDKLIKRLPEGIDGVGIDSYVIMPDHMHLILTLNSCKLRLGEIVRRFKAKTSRDTGIRLWQPNYYEHVVRNETALMKIREYMMNNPLKRKIEFEQFYKE